MVDAVGLETSGGIVSSSLSVLIGLLQKTALVGLRSNEFYVIP